LKEVASELIEDNPCDGLKRKDVVGTKKHRQRTLNDTELFALWRASGRLGYPFGPLYRLLVLTGTRWTRLREGNRLERKAMENPSREIQERGLTLGSVVG
jgi:hypothetical protein